MSTRFQSLFAITSLLSIGYITYKNLIKRYSNLSLQNTIKISQQLKYHMLIISILFVQSFQDPLNINKPPNTNTHPNTNKQLRQFYKSKLQQMYNDKKISILIKYEITLNIFQEAIKQYSWDSKLNDILDEIGQCMQNALNNKYPDISVNKKAYLITKQQIKFYNEQIYKMVLKVLANKLKQHFTKYPFKSTKDHRQFTNIVRNINMYEMKRKYLLQKGFDSVWGCPNQVLLKVQQKYKMEDREFKEQLQMMESIYDQLVQAIAQDPLGFNLQTINTQFVNYKQNIKKGYKILTKSVIQMSSIIQQPFILSKTIRTQSQPQNQLNKNKPLQLNQQQLQEKNNYTKQSKMIQ